MGNICCGSKPEGKKASALQSSDDQDVFDHQRGTNSSTSLGSGVGIDPATGAAMMVGPGGGVDPSNGMMMSAEQQQQLQQQQQQQQEHVQDEGLNKALREEQARLELIVQATGRRMVAVRSTRGSTGYYDQGFAAALAQHLEQTTEFPKSLPRTLPTVSTAATNETVGSSADSTMKSASSQPQQEQQSTIADTSSEGQSSVSKTDQQQQQRQQPSLYNRLASPQWENVQLGLEGTGLAGCAGKNPITYMDDIAESFLDATIPKKERLFAGSAPFLENLL